MSDSWQIRIYEHQRPVHSESCRGPLELGRQVKGEQGPFASFPKGPVTRLIVARLEDQEGGISRRHVLLDRQADGSMRIENVSGTLSIGIGNGPPMGPGEVRLAKLPIVLTVGKKTVRVQAIEADLEPDSSNYRSLAAVTAPPRQEPSSLHRFPGLNDRSSEASDANCRMLRWLQDVMGVLQSAAGDADFFQKAAQAVVNITGLDTGRVMLLDCGLWQTRAFASGLGLSRTSEDERQPSRSVLNRVRAEKRTYWEVPRLAADAMASMVGVAAVVAAPLLDPGGTVIGVVYGDRCRASGLFEQSLISELEAMLVELIASGVSAGMAREEQERIALASRVQFEQFFTRELSEQLTRDPKLLDNRAAEVSLLFCDIRGFSRIIERSDPRESARWIGDVIDVLSDCVQAHNGVLVDYVGDELLAMWGAPAEQPEHARLACRAAIDMLKAMPDINERWRGSLPEPISVGIGVNSGMAQVGNRGSLRKLKYGPFGNTVNLASRVQGATKYVRSPILITGSTRSQLASDFLTRRLCRVRVVNIAEPVELHELAISNESNWDELKQGYETALAAFEARDFRRTAHLLSGILEKQKWQDDGPSLLLLSRAVHWLMDSSAEFDPVWVLPGK